jgi:hypothetical protein
MMRNNIALTALFVLAATSGAMAHGPTAPKIKINPPPPPFIVPHNVTAQNLSYIHSIRDREIKRINDILRNLRHCPPASP